MFRTTGQNYWWELFFRTIAQSYLSELLLRTISQNYFQTQMDILKQKSIIIEFGKKNAQNAQ